MNVNVKITQLDRPELLSANAWINNELWSIYFSADRKTGYIINVSHAMMGDTVRITEGPSKDIGSGVIVDIIP
jgi:hypothetical protein